jgi:hypothetical protein
MRCDFHPPVAAPHIFAVLLPWPGSDSCMNDFRILPSSFSGVVGNNSAVGSRSGTGSGSGSGSGSASGGLVDLTTLP